MNCEKLIYFDIKKHKEMIEIHRDLEIALEREKEKQESYLATTGGFWRGEAADSMRGELGAFLEDGNYAEYERLLSGIREVMEEFVPQMEKLQQRCSDFPNALGRSGVSVESETYIFVDEEAVWELSRCFDKCIEGYHLLQNGLRNVIGMGNGIVDFGEVSHEVEMLTQRSKEIEGLKEEIILYAKEMKRLDETMQMAYAAWYMRESEGEELPEENSKEEAGRSAAEEHEHSIYDLSGFLFRGEMYSNAELLDIVRDAYENGEISYNECRKLTHYIEMLVHVSPAVCNVIMENMCGIYENIVARDRVLQESVLVNVLGWDMENIDENLGENFFEDLRSELLRWEITDATSIMIYLVTISHESICGTNLCETVPIPEYARYTRETRGAGLIQVTGETQLAFLKFLRERGGLPAEHEEIVKLLIKGLENNNTAVEGLISPTEFIATYYPTESSLWFWTELDNAWIPNQEAVSLNEYIEAINGVEGVDEELLFLATQYTVNGTEFYPEALYYMPLGQIRIMEDEEWNGDLAEAEILFNAENIGDATHIEIREITENGNGTEGESAMPIGWQERYSRYLALVNYLNGGITDAN